MRTNFGSDDESSCVVRSDMASLGLCIKPSNPNPKHDKNFARASIRKIDRTSAGQRARTEIPELMKLLMKLLLEMLLEMLVLLLVSVLPVACTMPMLLLKFARILFFRERLSSNKDYVPFSIECGLYF
jgi:hypothetical protein